MAGTPLRRASYKDVLQPALHRRFSSTAILLLVASYLETLLLADWTSFFWSWFPLGPAGFRAFLIFSCGLSILILRIAHYHAGLKTTDSGLQTLGSSLLSASTYETAFWYGISSLVFCPIFLLSTSESTNLKWITYYHGDRPRLNERPLFLSCYLGICAVLQTVHHYKYDVDRLDFSASWRSAAVEKKALGFLPKSFQAVLFQLPGVLGRCSQQAVASLFLCLPVYLLLLRSIVWGWALMFLRPFYNLPRTTMVPHSWPVDVFLLSRCVYAGTMINFIWSVGNTAFSVFMVKEPLKNGNPLTSDSKDPNGSLLNGLKSQKLSIKSFAMWELCLIARDFETRRQAIYCDIDRKDGPMWCQVYAICMGLLKQMELRVDEYGRPRVTAAAQPAERAEQRQRVSAPLRQDAIFSANKVGPGGLLGGVERALDQIARAPGSSPVSELSPLAKKTWKDAKDKVLTKEQQAALSTEHLRTEIEHWSTRIMKIGFVGTLFRHDFRARLAGLVLGTPYAEATLYTRAVEALCLLAVHSLSEDKFGNVHRDVPSIIRTLTALIRKLQAVKQQFPLHWTDPLGSKECPEVDQVVEALQSGLEQVVATFEPYSADLRLSLGDVRLAKEAAVKQQQQQQQQQQEAEAAGPKTSRFTTTTQRAAGDKKTETARVQKRDAKRVEMEQVR